MMEESCTLPPSCIRIHSSFHGLHLVKQRMWEEPERRTAEEQQQVTSPCSGTAHTQESLYKGFHFVPASANGCFGS